MNNSQSIQFHLNGLSCGGCVGRAEKALKAVDGVLEASVNLAAKTAKVTFSPPAAVEDFSDALSRAGYPMASETANFKIEGMNCASCVSRIETALLGVKSIRSANVNLVKETATISYIPGWIEPGEIASLILKSGYKSHLISSDDSRLKQI